MATSMTSREFFGYIAGRTDLPTEYTKYALAAIEKLDEKNASRKPTKTSKEAADRKVAVLSFIKEQVGAVDRGVISAAVGCTPEQATAACSALVREGVLVKGSAKVDKRPVTVYSLAE